MRLINKLQSLVLQQILARISIGPTAVYGLKPNIFDPVRFAALKPIWHLGQKPNQPKLTALMSAKYLGLADESVNHYCLQVANTEAQESLAEAYRVLKPNGFLILTMVAPRKGRTIANSFDIDKILRALGFVYASNLQDQVGVKASQFTATCLFRAGQISLLFFGIRIIVAQKVLLKPCLIKASWANNNKLAIPEANPLGI